MTKVYRRKKAKREFDSAMVACQKIITCMKDLDDQGYFQVKEIKEAVPLIVGAASELESLLGRLKDTF